VRSMIGFVGSSSSCSAKSSMSRIKERWGGSAGIQGGKGTGRNRGRSTIGDSLVGGIVSIMGASNFAPCRLTILFSLAFFKVTGTTLSANRVVGTKGVPGLKKKT